VNERFAELAAERGFATFALVRDERYTPGAAPIAFDPLREAGRALEAARHIANSCGFPGTPVAFVGVSMGGLEAILAQREAAAIPIPSRVAVLDPLLEPGLVAAHLDSYWHAFATDSMQAYFRRILRVRYEEPESTTFEDLLSRKRADAQWTFDRDRPIEWLCDGDRSAYAIFVSDDDPVLGMRQSEFARRGGGHCGLVRSAKVKGHVGLACRPALFRELIDFAIPPEDGAPVNSTSKPAPSPCTPGSGRTPTG